MKVSRILGMALLGLALTIVAGCGGDDNKTATTPTQTTAPAQAAETTSVTADEYKFTPSDVTVKKGDSITVKNGGKIVHNLTVEKGPDPKKKSEKLAGTPTFAPGGTEKVTVDLSPGKYVMVCTVPGHRELGMTGTFTVK
jgi:nitrite reductase (NO-forming)